MTKPSVDPEMDIELAEYLRFCRQDKGIMSPGHPRPAKRLLAAVGIDSTLPTNELLSRWITRLKSGTNRMQQIAPEEARLVELALNFSSQPGKWLARAQTEADSRGESRRTIVRRCDASLNLLAATILAQDPPEDGPEEKVAIARLRAIIEKREQLRIIKFDVEVRVSHDHVRVLEVVEVESQSPDAQFYVVAKTLPYKDSKVETKTLWGAKMLSVEQPNKHWLVELLEFPDPLPTAKRHRFSVLHYARAMAPMWTASSFHDADELTVRVWYEDQKPRPNWLVKDFPSGLLRGDDIEPIIEEHATELEVDRFGSVAYRFADMRPGRSYGLAWTSRERHDES